MSILSRIRIALALTIAVFAIAATYISFTIVERQNLLRDASRYNVVWAASQAVSEFALLEERVAAFAAGAADVDQDQVQLRVDVMSNRLSILRRGDVAAAIARDLERVETVQAFAVALAEIGPLAARMDQPGVPQQILKILAPIEDPLKRLTAGLNQFNAEQVGDDHEALSVLHRTFSALAAGLVLCGFALICILLAQNRVISKARDSLRLLTDDLRVAKEAAEFASNAKSRFLANMSHELRTPLNAIVGFSDLIAQEMLGPVGTAKYKEYARDILRSGTHMADLVNDILTMAKLEAGHFDVELRPLDLRLHVEATLSIFLGTEMARGSDVAVEAIGEWPCLRADERALRQMLLNLLSNAVKFSSPGGPIRIVSHRLPEGELCLSVSDQGVGMTRQQAELAVQPFRQVDDSLARKYEGTGLGLSIVKGLIESHKGRLLVESEPGKGSKISLVFPKDLVTPMTLVRVA
jgi:signal transduction histidine kinase